MDKRNGIEEEGVGESGEKQNSRNKRAAVCIQQAERQQHRPMCKKWPPATCGNFGVWATDLCVLCTFGGWYVAKSS